MKLALPLTGRRSFRRRRSRTLCSFIEAVGFEPRRARASCRCMISRSSCDSCGSSRAASTIIITTPSWTNTWASRAATCRSPRSLPRCWPCIMTACPCSPTELVTDNPGFYDTVQEERFSVFFDLPASTYAFQLRVNSDTDELKSHGLPEFCDWDLVGTRASRTTASRGRCSWTRRCAAFRRWRRRRLV